MYFMNHPLHQIDSDFEYHELHRLDEMILNLENMIQSGNYGDHL